MAALVFAATMVKIPVFLDAGGKTMIHLGNVLCLISGFLLGPVYGGMAAGLGSFIFDLMGDPDFVLISPFTLVFKFLMAYVCGLVSRRLRAESPSPANMPKNALAGALGMITYLALHLPRSYFWDVWVLGIQPNAALASTATRAVISLINAAIAVVVSVPLYTAVKKVLDAAGFRIRKM